MMAGGEERGEEERRVVAWAFVLSDWREAKIEGGVVDVEAKNLKVSQASPLARNGTRGGG